MTRRWKLRVSVLLPAAVALLGWGERPLISGRIVDAGSLEPIAGAMISLSLAGLQARSDRLGAFALALPDERLDTLVIEHPAYAPARFVVGGGPEMVAMTFSLHRVSIVDEADEEGVALDRQLADAVMLTGGASWAAEDFHSFVRSVAHPLELLLYSGLAERISERGEDRRCVELAGAEACAAIWVNGVALGPRALDGRFASEIHGFVIVGPREAQSTLGHDAPGGVVMVFLRGGPR